MNFANLYLTTLIPEIPRIYNYNNQIIQNYLDVIYSETDGVIIVPVNTTGRVKGSNGEFVNLVVDNLTVRSQYTNLYNNITTADYQYYSTYIGPDASHRDASISAGEDGDYRYIDAIAPYYKIDNVFDYAFKTDNLSQVVQVLLDVSTGDPFVIKINDTQTISVTAANAPTTWLELICVGLPGISSSDNIWIVKRYGGTITIS
jgi:hypothetical protein